MALAAALIAGLGGPAAANASLPACTDSCGDVYENTVLACYNEPTVHEQDICTSSAEFEYDICVDLCVLMHTDPTDNDYEIGIEIWF